jgi:hypothetical protein
MAHTGYFIVADITGYTQFLTQSELEHAEDILDSLFKAQLDFFQPPLILNGFRGDAILAYVLEGTFVQGQTLLETLEKIYYAFTDLREQMRQNTTCTCNACRNISNLDLKMFVHYGQFLLQKMGNREEMLGAEVIVVHRMTKNHVKEQTGLQAYALFTEKAIDALNLGDIRATMSPYAESYEHLGEVKMLVHDLGAAFKRWRETRRIFVKPEDTHIHLEMDLPVPPALAWDYITKTELKCQWLQMEAVSRVDDLGGRIRSGSQFHCAHSAADIRYTIVDWRPFDYYTTDAIGFFGLPYLATYRLVPTTHGCRFVWLCTFSEEHRAQLEPLYRPILADDIKVLRAMIETDLVAGKIVA